jgi:hypothetical protein
MGGARGTNSAVPGGAMPLDRREAGHPLRDAYPGSILPTVDLTGAAGRGPVRPDG